MALALRVDPERLLSELPRFFQSFGEGLTECTQNAFRAGAKNLVIRLDRDARTLRLEDDGSGADDPEALLTAGMTGWQDTLVEPAGLGLFALLGLSKSATIESRSKSGRHWRFTLTEAAFRGEPIAFEELPPVAGTGLTIEAILKESADLRLNLTDPESTFRQLYPMTVTLTTIEGGNERTETVPPLDLGNVYLDTPVGRLYRGRRNINPYRHGPLLRLITEHRVLSLHDAGHELTKILDQLEPTQSLARLLNATLYLVVDKDCGLVPKLPDRREPIVDQAYHKAIATLGIFLARTFDAEGVKGRLERLNLPKTLTRDYLYDAKNTNTVTKAAALHPIFVERTGIDVARHILRLLYRHCRWDLYEAMQVSVSGDDIEVEFEHESILAREALVVRDPEVAAVLNRNGIPARSAQTGEVVTIEVLDAKVTTANANLPVQMGVARAIEARGSDGRCIAPLERVAATDLGDIRVDGEDGDAYGYYIVKGSVEDGLKALKSAADFIGVATFSLRMEGDLWPYLDSTMDYDLDETTLLHDAVEQYTTEVMPQAAQAEKRYHTAYEVKEALLGLKAAAAGLRRRAEAATSDHPELDPSGLIALVDSIDATDFDCDRWKPAE